MNKLQFKTRQVTAEDGTQLATYAYGTGDTPAIIANGLGGTLIAWTPLLEALSKTYRFISWDYRGLYDSERPRDTSAFSVNDHVSDMQVVLNAYGVETAVGFGWSMGVQVSIQAAADLKRLTSLVLLNGTFGRIFDTAFHPLSRPALPLLNRLAIKAAPWLPSVVSAVTRQSWFIDALDSAQLVDSSVDRQIFESVAKEFSRLDFDAYHRIMGALAEHDGTGALARLDIPILFLTGSRDLVTPPTVAEIVQGLAPQTVVHEIEGATHYALLEYPKNVLDQIHQFIAALDSPINSK